MHPSEFGVPDYDPARHESHLVAMFHDDATANEARSAVLAAGIVIHRVELMASGEELRTGAWHPVQDLFVPEDDYLDYHHALGRGHVLLIVRPTSAAERDAAVAALEGSAPLDPEEHGRRWRGNATSVERRAINHATVSRADMWGRAVGGRDEVILDMTGQKMTVRTMSEEDMEKAPFAPLLDPAERPPPLTPPAPERRTATRGTTYTYGVPPEVVARMTPEQQVMAQPPALGQAGERTARGNYLKVVGGQTHFGWRETHPSAVRVRSYVTERPGGAPTAQA